ncbi:sugar phosphate isomerase/epimerase family protein [Natrinema altunense]|uniref:AP endonuclease, family 2 n=1 Tax=Natrinema altunense (strain JCM 12890 / CGMCC 1.3731 / AJ2) TaxID=1227494 RepID=L9ZHF9_NATA2|nr:sugar phosphate isomerase/epimerase [Natrinema altunense]ELY84588.1 AP endonuclease, family 2 [Natrinema altunense JCM 12890]
MSESNLRFGAAMDIRFETDVESFVAFLTDAGLEHVELRAGYLDVREDGPDSQTLRTVADEYDVTYSVHAPHLDVAPGAINDHIRSGVVEATTDALEFAAAIDAVGVVVHGGGARTRYPTRVREYTRSQAVETVRACARRAADVNVPLCLENQRRKSDVRRFTATPDRLASFLEDVGVGPDALRITLDVGHAKASDIDYERFVDRFGDRIHLAHLHDNDGKTDSHDPLPSFRSVGADIDAPYNILEMKSRADITRSLE